MNWTVLNRKIHRWLSITFMATVILIFVLLGAGSEPAQWVYFLPLPPLFVLMLTGTIMFFLPYVRRSTKRELGA